MSLFLCAQCNRHVKRGVAACPFCGESVAQTSHDGSNVVRRLSRAALVGSAGMMMVAGGCSAQPVYGACPPDSIALSAPCGITNITTTCAGASATCVAGSCNVAPIANDCSVTVILGDGTSHTLAVSVSQCPFGKTLSASPENTDFTSATCALADAGPLGDAHTDASTD